MKQIAKETARAMYPHIIKVVEFELHNGRSVND